ncbi:MAG: hypothetical protein JWQ57_2301, partial [Mucilaginibacter sp.]|nr:hypothetical protein [Mucilaginibacter sp.]
MMVRLVLYWPFYILWQGITTTLRAIKISVTLMRNRTLRKQLKSNFQF